MALTIERELAVVIEHPTLRRAQAQRRDRAARLAAVAATLPAVAVTVTAATISPLAGPAALVLGVPVAAVAGAYFGRTR